MFTVCAWFTPDYAHWAERFRDSLQPFGCACDLEEVQRPPGPWESVTRMKASRALAFRRRHPGKTIILSDVDAVATGDLGPLANLDGDIALHFQAKRIVGRQVLLPRSGTMVLRDTETAVAFVENWVDASSKAVRSDTDEATLCEAIAKTPRLRISNISGTECASLICHSIASLEQKRVSPVMRYLLANIATIKNGIFAS
jgi:hypothetical protein